jgi:hypothetical protein
MKRLVLAAAVFVAVTSSAWAEQVHVEDLKSNVITIDVASTDTIDVVKSKIADGTKVAPECQKLIWNGTFLVSDKTIGDYGIAEGATIEMIQHC